ncbi:RyR domain-containing protein [Hymenobacter sp. M29]|uniref:RyR domain-containing protein n=1 Tax=Hymenobacter mellowenesis TaxID=3063995 RepID=A0ABT9ABK4_9BACT|nr:RyR domain-containing protein [Hymenobacter sp. M29]MDO7846918.1 RyR domain-containing protein [Hymenobacter sp. M29]
MPTLPDLELVAEKVHEAWMKTKQSQGVTTRLSETGEELMVPYAQLSEPAKELDRMTVRTVYAAIEALGS